MSNKNKILDLLAIEISKVFEKFSKEDLLIINRGLDSSFFSVFSESLFHYKSGVILVERFYKKNKCKSKGIKHKTYKEADKKLMSDFQKFSNSLPNSHELSEEELEKYNKELSDFKKKVSDIEPELKVLNSYQYGDSKLIEFNSIDEGYREEISLMYSNFALNILSVSTWSSLSDVEIIVKTIEDDDYVDLIVFPVK